MNEPKAEASITSGTAHGRDLEVESLLNDLRSKDSSVRRKARESLLSVGEPATVALVRALSDPDSRVRWEAGKLLDQIDVPWTKHADADTMRALVGDLCSKDGLVRVRVRMALVAIGGKAVGYLDAALKDKREVCRWEAIKALSEIHDRAAVGILVQALKDESFEVRWLASEGLIAIGRPALAPLMRELVRRPDSIWLREGVHRIFHGVEREDNRQILRPVLNALEDSEAELSVPLAAQTALDQFRGTHAA